MTVLHLALLTFPGALALSFTNGAKTLRRDVPTADVAGVSCQVSSAGCTSDLEVKEGTNCVMPDKVPQHDMGATIDESIGHFQSMLQKYYLNVSVLESMISMSEKGREVLVQKMARAIGKKKFVVGAIGSSITAAHDNCLVDSYPSQLESLVSPLFKQAGVDFVARNGGVGGECGDNHVNQAYCLEQLVGDDLDVAHWSWDYSADDPTSQENFIRISLSMSGQPMPMLLTLGRGHLPSHEDFSKVYGALGYHSLAATSSTPPGVPDMAAGNDVKFGFVGDGLHKLTRLAEKFPEGHCRRVSTSVLWRNWHGGPMLYQLIGDALGWTYVSALKEALVQTRSTKQEQHLLVPRMPLPEGLKSNLATSPRCISFNQPSVSPAVMVVPDQSGNMNISEVSWRKEKLPESERNEPLCEHLDICGTAMSDDDGLTFDLQAKYQTPLADGILVVCIGGMSPDVSEEQRSHGWRTLIAKKKKEKTATQKSDSSNANAAPPLAKFPHCYEGSLTSVKVDGEEYDMQHATMWDQMTKCGEFKLRKKDARYVTIKSSCGVTHVFAM